MTGPTIDTLHTKEDRLAYAEVFLQSLVGPVAMEPGGLERIERRVFEQGDTWIAREGDRVVGGAAIFDVGQFWGGRSLRCAAVSAVAIAPDCRGRGVARTLLTHAFEKARETGRSIAALYPATLGLYRRLGFELAGTAMICNVPIRLFDVDREPSRIRPYEPHDLESVRALYADTARSHDGWLDRSERFWKYRVLEGYRGRMHGYVVNARDGSGIDGHVFFSQSAAEGGHMGYNLYCTEIAARDASAWSQLGSLLASHRSMAGTVSFRMGHPRLPLGLLVESRDVTFDHRLDWMLRVLDVPRALGERGYHPLVSGDATFALYDAMFPDNAGAWRLVVRDGRGSIERAKSADVTLDIRGLAALYGSYFAPTDLVMLGLAEGDRAALERLAALFAGRSADLADMF